MAAAEENPTLAVKESTPLPQAETVAPGIEAVTTRPGKYRTIA
jgi:hypothetical protein